MNGKIQDGHLIIEVPLQEPEMSSTGKTLVVASSHGVQRLAVQVDGKNVYVTANAFVYPVDQRKSGKRKTKLRQLKDKKPS
jgi:hypothetical protein